MVVLLALAAAAPAQDREVDLLVRLLQAGDEYRRDAAAQRLAALGERAVPAVAPLLDDPWPDFREAACFCLEVGGGAGAAAADKLAALAATDDFPEVREAALRALASLDPVRAVPLLRKAMEDPFEDVRWGAEWSLKNLPPEAVVPFLTHARESVRAAARSALERADPAPVAAVAELLARGNVDAAYLLDAWDDRALPAVDALVAAAESEDPELAAAALDALAGLSGGPWTSVAFMALQRPEAEVRVAAVRVLLRPDLPSPALLASVLDDPSPEVRRLALLGLKDADSPRAAAALQERIGQPEFHLAAARSLWRTKGQAEPYRTALRERLRAGDFDAAADLAEMGADAEPAVPDLVAAAGRAEDPWEQVKIAEALLAAGAPEKAWPVLIATFDDEEGDGRALAVEPATRLGVPFLAGRLLDREEEGYLALAALEESGPEAAKAVAPLLAHEDEGVRRSAWLVLQGLDRDARPAVPALMRALASPDAKVRRAAAGLLPDLTDDREGARKAVAAALEREADPDVRGEMAASLWRLGAPRERLVRVLVARLRDPDSWWWAEFHLAEFGEEAVPLLAPLLETLEDPWDRIKVAVAMAKGGAAPDLVEPVLRAHLAAGETAFLEDAFDALGDRAVPILRSGLANASPVVRQFCVERLGARVTEFPEDHVIEADATARALAPLVEDPAPEVRQAVVDVLYGLGPLAAPCVPQLTAMLDGARPVGAASVLRAIGRPAKAAAPRLARLIREDDDAAVRRSAIGALGSLGKEAGEHASVLEEAAREDPDEGVRFVAVHALHRVAVERGNYAIGIGGGGK